MKKIWSLLIVLALMISISSLALAEEPPEGNCNWHFDEGNPENDCNLYCDNYVFENISLAYSTFEECEECRLEFLDNQTDENETEDPETNETEDPDGNETEEPDGNETEEPDGNESEEPEGNETEEPEGNESEIDGVTKEETEIMNDLLGAEIRLLQLEKAITKNLFKGERAVEVLKALEYDTSKLEAILAEMRLLLEEVQAADPSSDDSVQVFVDLKSDARKLTKEFRETVKELLSDVKYKELKEQIQEMVCEQVQSLSKKIQNRVKQFNRNQIHRLYIFIGEEGETLAEQYENGDATLEQVKSQICKMVNRMIKEKKNEIFSELKGEKIRNKIHAAVSVNNATGNFSEREQERLQNRLQKAEDKGNNNLIQQIQNKIANQNNNGNGKSRGNSK